MKTKSQVKRIKAQTTFKAWAVVNNGVEFIKAVPLRQDARWIAICQSDRVVRCEIRLIEGRK